MGKGFFDDIFGGAFDFNGDGKTTFDEEFLGLMIIDECEREDREIARRNKSIFDMDEDDDSLLDDDHL